MGSAESPRKGAFKVLLGSGNIASNLESVVEEALPKGFSPIPDLKAGDLVRWKNEFYRADKIPGLEETVTVHRVLDPSRTSMERGAPLRDEDFTVLFFDKRMNVIIEFAFDSRRFERVE